MSDSKVQGLLTETVEKIKSSINVDTVMGSQINTPDGTTIIPINKVNYGFASGGSDIPSKNGQGYFGGGAGGAVTVSPIGFIVVKNGEVRVMQIEPFTSSIDRVIQQAPDFVEKIANLFSKGKTTQLEESDSVDNDTIKE